MQTDEQLEALLAQAERELSAMEALAGMLPEVPEGPYGDPQGRWDLATGKLRRIVRVRPAE